MWGGTALERLCHAGGTTFSLAVSLLSSHDDPAMNIPDERMVSEFQQGNDLAFVRLYNFYKQPLYLFCVKILGDADDAKDVVQSVFGKIYEERRKLTHPDRFKGWVFTIARNMCFTLHRRAKYFDAEKGNGHEASASNTDDDLSRSEETEILARAIAALKPEYREVLVLREYQEFSYREIADIVGCTESAVKSRLFAARQQLHKDLKPFFVERK